MRQCPRCNRAYSDQTLIYCLDDGSALIPYTPAATLQRPAARLTIPLETELLPATQPTLLYTRKNSWLLYTVIALLAVGLVVAVVLYLVSGDDEKPRPRELVASPANQTPVNSNQGDAPGKTQPPQGETKEEEEGKGKTASSNTTSSNTGSEEKDDPPSSSPSPSPPPVPQSPSWRLVGVWRANLSAGGKSIEITYTFKADGTSKFIARDRQGRRATGQGTWQYSEGTLYQTFGNGASGKGSIEWIDDDTFEVTIIDNGVPAESGQKRRYHRVH